MADCVPFIGPRVITDVFGSIFIFCSLSNFHSQPVKFRPPPWTGLLPRTSQYEPRILLTKKLVECFVTASLSLFPPCPSFMCRCGQTSLSLSLNFLCHSVSCCSTATRTGVHTVLLRGLLLEQRRARHDRSLLARRSQFRQRARHSRSLVFLGSAPQAL